MLLRKRIHYLRLLLDPLWRLETAWLNLKTLIRSGPHSQSRVLSRTTVTHWESKQSGSVGGTKKFLLLLTPSCKAWSTFVRFVFARSPKEEWDADGCFIGVAVSYVCARVRALILLATMYHYLFCDRSIRISHRVWPLDFTCSSLPRTNQGTLTNL